MSNMYKEKKSCNIANQSGTLDVLNPGNVVELKVDLPIQNLKKGQRAYVDKIYKNKIRILPVKSTTECIVKTKHVFKLSLGA